MGGKYSFDDIPPEERQRIAEACGLTEEERLVFEARARTDSADLRTENVRSGICALRTARIL